jgi:hypothetical protein
VIKYTLQCDDAHSFEGWFRNSGDFDLQCSRNLVSCPVCGSNDVRKSLMAPAVSTARSRDSLADAARTEMLAQEAAARPEGTAPAQTAAMQPSALLPKDLQQKEVVEALRLLRARIVENSENVGENFAREARKIHYGEAEERSIYGETTPKDAEALMEEGISVFPLPDLPDDKN